MSIKRISSVDFCLIVLFDEKKKQKYATNNTTPNKKEKIKKGRRGKKKEKKKTNVDPLSVFPSKLKAHTCIFLLIFFEQEKIYIFNDSFSKKSSSLEERCSLKNNLLKKNNNAIYLYFSSLCLFCTLLIVCVCVCHTLSVSGVVFLLS